jgi:hypothetical protein
MVTNIRSKGSTECLISKSPKEIPASLELDPMDVSDSSLLQPISPISTLSALPISNLSNSQTNLLTSPCDNSGKIHFQKYSFSSSSISSSSFSNNHYHDSVGKGTCSNATKPLVPVNRSRVLAPCSHRQLCCTICQNDPNVINRMNNIYIYGSLPVKRKLSTSSTPYSKKISYKSFLESSHKNCAINNSYLSTKNSKKRFKIN